MGIAYNQSIIQNGLVSASDSRNTKSYSGETFYNLLTSNTLGNPSWANGATQLTCICIIKILGNDTSFAYHPIQKWNTGTPTASFVLYHFQNYQGNSPSSTNRLGWYANGGGTWKSLTSLYQTTSGNTYFVALQYNSTSGGQLWINGSKIGGRGGNGTLGSGTSSVTIDGNVSGRTGIHKVEMVDFYDRELSDSEITYMYNTLKNRL
jgi:hypothetical protein